MMNELVLAGCRPVPLAHYLKALAVLRLVGEQQDPRARGSWQRERFVLHTRLSRTELEQFFLDAYEPTPITGPWNGGSGYFEKDNTKAIDALRASNSARFEVYRETIEVAKRVLERTGLKEKPSSDQKEDLLRACRGAFPDVALKWLDAAFVLSGNGAKFPPLLGTGGNDGRLDFSNNFMQRLVSLFDSVTGLPEPGTVALLRASLFGEATTDLVKKAAIGQFYPGNAGGVNSTTGFAAASLINPWDFVFMLEGAVMFAAAAGRSMEAESGGVLAYPFTVRAATVGYESAAASDEGSARAETWMPLWERPVSTAELSATLSEGRARVGGRAARHGVDFARAVAGLGIDRGIDAFQRYGFHVRNGLSYFAVPIGRFQVHAEPRAELLHEIDVWLDRFRGKASAQTAPAAAGRALRQLEASIFDLCLRGGPLRQQQVLLALGQCEQVMAKSARWTTDSFLHPVPALSGQWLKDCDDGSAEFRLAASLASVWGRYGQEKGKARVLSIRQHLEPVATWKGSAGLVVRWDWEADADVVWSPGHIVDAMNAVLQRRLMRAVQAGMEVYPDIGRVAADLGDIADFINGAVDEQRLIELFWGCLLLDWTRTSAQQRPSRRSADAEPVGALYALLKLCFSGVASRSAAGSESETTAQSSNGETPKGDSAAGSPRLAQLAEVRLEPRLHRAAASGEGARAATEASRRLRASGLSPALQRAYASPALARRTAAALLFPVNAATKRRLAALVLREPSQTPSQENLTAKEGIHP